jgi:hypothetical protein
LPAGCAALDGSGNQLLLTTTRSTVIPMRGDGCVHTLLAY